MINEAKLTEHYGIIADKLNEMIPCEWDNVYMYGEVLEDSREVYFYFKPAGEDEFVYGHDIPDTYGVDEDAYDDALFELMDIVAELYNDYSDGATWWTSITFSLDNTGKCKADFRCYDVLNSPFTSGERQIIWEYEVLGLEPDEGISKWYNDIWKTRKASMTITELLHYKMNDEECRKATKADGLLKEYNDSHNPPLYKGIVGRERVAPGGWVEEYVYTIYINDVGYMCVHELDDVPPRWWSSIETPQMELEKYIPIALERMNYREIVE